MAEGALRNTHLEIVQVAGGLKNELSLKVAPSLLPLTLASEKYSSPS